MQGPLAPFYPRAFEETKDRTLAFLAGDEIVTEHGEVLHVPGYPELKAEIFSNNLLTFTADDFLETSWFSRAIEAGERGNYSAHANQILSVSLRSGSRIRHIGRWPNLSGGLLRQLRGLFDYCEAGVYTTPAALGQGLMRRLWPSQEPALRRPPWEAWRAIHSSIIGGRSDLLQPGEYAEVWEEDQNNAYASAIRTVPGGLCCHCYDTRDLRLYAWDYSRYSWRTPPHGVSSPIIGVRDGNRSYYPSSSPEWSEAWLGREEAAAALEAGYQLRYQSGWAWTELRSSFAPWASEMDRYKREHTGIIRDWIKLATVGAIGRFGMDRVSYSLVPWENAPAYIDGLRIITVCQTGETPFVAVPESLPPTFSEHLIQVSARVHGLVRLSTRERAEAYRKAGTLVAVNFDAIYTKSEPDGELGTDAGQWKRQRITDAKFTARRWIVGVDEDGNPIKKTPGQT